MTELCTKYTIVQQLNKIFSEMRLALSLIVSALI